MFTLGEGCKYVMSLNYINMRNGIDGLQGLIRYAGLDPTDGRVYLFANKSRTILKLLHWERGGFVIYHKRLESGRISHRIFKHRSIAFRSIRWDEIVLLVEGININTHRRKRYNLGEKIVVKSCRL